MSVLIRRFLMIGVSACTLLGIDQATASGFGVKLNSGWTAGMANAGSGVVDDPLASFINPAAMILNNCHHAALHVTGVFPHTKFTGTGRNLAVAPPFVGFTKTGSSKNAAKTVAVPSGGVVVKLHDRVRLGFVVSAPFGLKFNYGSDSPTQFHTIKSSMETVNLTPSLALRLNDMISIGAGFQAQWSKVSLQRKTPLPVPVPIRFPAGTVKISGDDWSYGWTAGVLFQLTKQWNVGFSYRSKMLGELEGHIHSDFGLSGKSFAKVHFPNIFTLSTSLQITPCWTLYADAIRTMWSSTRILHIRRGEGGPTLDLVPQNWRDSWFLSLGANWKINEHWSARVGAAYDKTPTRDETRIPAIPDSNKHWLATGVTYTIGKYSATLSYGHEFFKKAKINLGPLVAGGVPTAKGSLVGKTKSHIDMVSFQVNYKL